MSCQFSWADTQDIDVNVQEFSEPEYDSSIEYFCVEHLQPLIPAEELEFGQEQVCLGCHPEYLSMQPVTYAEGTTPLFPSGVAVAGSLSGGWSNCPTLIGQDQTILYKVYFTDTRSRYGTFYLRFVFSSSVQSMPYFNFSSDGEYWTERHDIPGTWSNFEAAFNFTNSIGSASLAVMGSVNNGYYPVSVPFKGSAVSGNTLYGQCQAYNALAPASTFRPDISVNIGSFAFSSEQFGGTVGGPGGGQVTPPEPEPPGFDDPDGWLGGLIDSIIEGINTVIEGISNVAQNIASLPSNIAGALSSLFQQVVSAVTSIGDQITNALVTLGNFIIDGLKQLFIPSDGYFESVVNDLSSFFSDRLGLLLYPFEFLVSLGDRIAGLETSEPTCTIPEIAYTDSDDTKYVLIEGQTLNVYELVGRNDIIVGMHQTYLTVMDGIIAFTLMALCWKRFDHIIGGGVE